MSQKKQSRLPTLKSGNYYAPTLEGILLPALTDNEIYVLAAFRLLSEVRQEAIKLVLGSMVIGGD